MEHKYIYGLKGIADFFGISFTATMYLIEHHGLPGIRKVRRRPLGNFPGGGRGVWALNRKLAEQYRHTRNKTPAYDPRRAVDALLKKFEGSGCTSIPELIKAGYIDDIDWCMALNAERERSNLHIPIMMHPDDLAQWMRRGEVKPVKKAEIYPETTNIFKKIRKTRGQKDGTRQPVHGEECTSPWD